MELISGKTSMPPLPKETQDFLASSPIKRYHLGCGTIFLKNWINIGLWEHLEHGRLYANPNGAEGTILLNYDLRFGIPAPPESLDAVYHSHMLEHISFEEGIVFLKQIFDALKPGAQHRVLVPDLEAFAKAYTGPDSLLLIKYRDAVLNDRAEIYQTKGAIFMGMLHNHGHKCGYDFETLSWALQRSGFQNVTRTLFQESQLTDIKEIEEYSPLRAFESLCVECNK
jgi:predicted SAM-dependent methyltransferase